MLLVTSFVSVCWFLVDKFVEYMASVDHRSERRWCVCVLEIYTYFYVVGKNFCNLRPFAIYGPGSKLMAAICNVSGFVDQLNDSRAPFKPKAPSLAVVICIVVKFDVAPSSDRMGCFVCCCCLSMLTVGSCQWILFRPRENMIDIMFLPRLLMFQHSAIVSPPSAIIFIASIGR
jgi:hypothetical protein